MDARDERVGVFILLVNSLPQISGTSSGSLSYTLSKTRFPSFFPMYSLHSQEKGPQFKNEETESEGLPKAAVK